MQELTTFPVILSRVQGNLGLAYVVASPDLPGLRVERSTKATALKTMKNQIPGWIKRHGRPAMTDPKTWSLSDRQTLTWVGLAATDADRRVTVTITLPADLAEWAQAQQVDLSAATTQALRQLRG